MCNKGLHEIGCTDVDSSSRSEQQYAVLHVPWCERLASIQF